MPYSPTVYVNGQAPAINATDLNKLTNELKSQATLKGVTHTLPTWTNGIAPAVSDPVPLNEMERVAQAVAVSLGDNTYTPTVWQASWTPARNATNLNHLENRAQSNRALIEVVLAPTAPTGLVVTPGNAQLTLTWNANPVGESVDAYQVYEFDLFFDNSWLTRPTSPRSYVMTTDHTGAPLVPGNTYNVRVGAHNSAGYGPFCAAVPGVPTGVTPPSNRYLDITFSSGLFAPADHSNGIIDAIFESTGVDARLSSWGGLPPNIYDSPGFFGYSPATSMTTDTNQRVYLFHPTSRGLPNPPGSTWATWQELRTTDPYWHPEPSDPGHGAEILAKASLNTLPNIAWPGFAFGQIRWFAFDILFPLNITGASLEFSNVWHIMGDIHSNGGNADPFYTEFYPIGPGADPKYYVFGTSPDHNSIPYIRQNLIQMTNADGSRFTANYNVWHEVVIGMKAAYDTTGWIEAWVNGVQKIVINGRALFDPSESGPYLQMQNYTNWPTSFVGGAVRSACVYGGMRAGLVRSDVQTR